MHIVQQQEEVAKDIMNASEIVIKSNRAAGIMFLTAEGETLLLKRGALCDNPSTWCIPGGRQESGESLEETARRECLEETGIQYEGNLEVLFDDGQFCYYLARSFEKPSVVINDESTGFAWVNPDSAELNIHPSLTVAFRVANSVTEYQKAELIKDNVLTSPQMFANVMLLAIRITGTGLAYRSSIGETVWRDPSIYLNEEFLKRCNGLQVIMDHPDSSVLTSEEFKKRSIGSIMLPYLKGDEVWGIAKIYDEQAANEILEGDISTSPSVVFNGTSDNTTLTTDSGEPLLIEGVPFLLDHIAIVTKSHGSKGVWDKGGEPAGVLLNNQEVLSMTENAKADAASDKLDAVISMLTGLTARMDQVEKNLPAEPLVTAADKEEVKKDEAKEEVKEELKEKVKEEVKDDADMKVCKDEDDLVFEDAADKREEEDAKYADAQAKCDSVLAGFGKSASRPLQGEGLMAYRTRLLRGLQAYSDSYKNINLRAIKDVMLLDLAEKQIFADAAAACRNSVGIADGQLIQINERDASGRTISKFKGSMSAWLDDFKVPGQRAMSFNTHNKR